MQNRTTGKSPFEIVYTKLPPITIDLTNIPTNVDVSVEDEQMADRIVKLHQEVKDHIEAANKKYKATSNTKMRPKEFKEGDQVMIFFRKGRVPAGKYNKLNKKKIGPFLVLQKCGPNAYGIQLPSEYNISQIFNIADIYAYETPDEFSIAT